MSYWLVEDCEDKNLQQSDLRVSFSLDVVVASSGLNRFKLHRHLADGTVKSVWLRHVFGLLRVRVRLVSLYMYTCDKEMTIALTQTSFVYINKILKKYYTYGASQPYNK